MALLDSATPSSDPAADFLARDNEALASLGILEAPKTDSLTNGGTDATFGNDDPFGGQAMASTSSNEGTTAADKPSDAAVIGAPADSGEAVVSALDSGVGIAELTGLGEAFAGVGGDNLSAPIRADSPPPTLQEVPEPDYNPFLADQAGATGFMDGGFGSGADTNLLDGGATGFSDGFGAPAAAGEQQAPSDRFAALRDADKERKLSPKVLAWQEKQKERIAKKDAEEEKKKQELREQAKRELSEWYRHYDEQMQLANQRNHEAENAFLEEREESVMAAGQDATPTGGAAWERVARLCDFNPKNSKCTKDVSRFRGMLLQLKSPNSASGATDDGAAFN